MSWEKSLDNESLKKILEEVYKDLQSVEIAIKSEDPLFNPSQEQEKYYKAIDGKGNIYLVRNPALMSYQASLYLSPIVRARPKKVLTYEQVKKGGYEYFNAGAEIERAISKRSVSI